MGTVHDVTERAVEPLDVRFGSVLSASPEQRDAVIAEMALWEIPRPDLAEGEVQWVTCRGTWYPPDYRSIPVRFYMTDRRVLMYEAGPDDVFDSRLSTGHVDFWFDDVAVFDPQPTTQRRPNAVPYLIITSRTGRPADGKRCDVAFNLDEEGARFIGTAIKALREHGGVHARVREGAAQEIDGSDPQQGPPAPQGQTTSADHPLPEARAEDFHAAAGCTSCGTGVRLRTTTVCAACLHTLDADYVPVASCRARVFTAGPDGAHAGEPGTAEVFPDGALVLVTDGGRRTRIEAPHMKRIKNTGPGQLTLTTHQPHVVERIRLNPGDRDIDVFRALAPAEDA